uniref:RNA polymerase n=1 Tax=Crocidura lasiura rhabdovirus 2 TaxID=3139486 RepID=A0AB38ZJU9_9RHAB
MPRSLKISVMSGIHWNFFPVLTFRIQLTCLTSTVTKPILCKNQK